ncbi:MAG: TatD family hydrolase [Pseudomonadota bacterium]
MLVDSHCHLDFPELAADTPGVLAEMRAHGVSHALCVCVTLGDFPRVRALAEQYANLYASVGTHPDYPDHPLVTSEELVSLADHPKVVAIGETGLDYYRLEGDLEWQRERFRTHIRAAKSARKPLIIHTRSAAEDTLAIMREEDASEAGGVMHCFTESWEVAQAALDLGFYISLSGIVTFKNAIAIKEVAKRVPLDRLLVETDSPYLAPVPYRGKTNRPAWVRYVAEEIARLREVTVNDISSATSNNFFRLFNIQADGSEVLQ